MAFVTLPKGIKAEVKFLKNGQLVVNVYHFECADPVATINLTQIATIIRDAWVANIQPGAASTISLEEIVCTDVSQEFGAQITFTAGLPEAGAGAGDDLPSNVAVVISNRTGLTGRSNRGRTYMAGMQASSITGNTVGAGLQTAYVNYHTEIQIEAAAIDISFGVASYVANGAPRTTAVLQPFSSFQVENITDSQRRRLPGRGT